jgi:uncharacterized protein YbjT (DUF2867 family)
MKRILVLGASGFAGGHLAEGLLAAGYAVRCLVRDPARIGRLDASRFEIVQGDISDPASLERALDGVEAVYVAIHTLTPQPGGGGQGFMDVETLGMRDLVAACRTKGVRRLIYITFLGISPDSPSAWVSGRWAIEQELRASGLDVTMLRPGQVVGVGGRGFDTMVSHARTSLAFGMGVGRRLSRNIAVDDLVYYLIGVLAEPRAYGQCFDVGSDEVLTYDQMIDTAADVLGRPHPIKIYIPKGLLIPLAPLIERLTGFPRGAVKSYFVVMDADAIGDPAPIRAILPRPLLTYRQAVEKALQPKDGTKSNA